MRRAACLLALALAACSDPAPDVVAPASGTGVVVALTGPDDAVSGAQVFFVDRDGATLAKGTTDGRGHAALDVAAGAEGKVFAIPLALATLTSDWLTVPDGTTTRVRLSIEVGEVAGTVLLPDGSAPPAGVPVEIDWAVSVPVPGGVTQGTRSLRATTDETGGFRVDGVPVEDLRVSVLARHQGEVVVGEGQVHARTGDVNVGVVLEPVTLLVPTIVASDSGEVPVDETNWGLQRPDGTWARVESTTHMSAGKELVRWPPKGAIVIQGPRPHRVAAFLEGYGASDTVDLVPDERGRSHATFRLHPYTRRTGLVITPRVTSGERPEKLIVWWTVNSSGRATGGHQTLDGGRILIEMGPGPHRVRLGSMNRWDDDRDWDWFPEEREVFVPPGEVVGWPVALRRAGGLLVETENVPKAVPSAGTVREPAEFVYLSKAPATTWRAWPLAPGRWTLEVTVDGAVRRGEVEVHQGPPMVVDPLDLPLVESE